MFRIVITAYFILAIICLMLHYRAETYFDAGIEVGRVLAWEEMERNCSDHWVKWVVSDK